MQLHGPKRVYTRESLEAWFDRLARDWDGFFASDQLAAGRDLYRNGGIRGVELSAGDAIIHCRIEKKDEYSVIEWSDSGIVVRSSSTDRALANTIAVAGLHEIEELVADEIPIIPVDNPSPADGGSAGNGGRGHPAAGVHGVGAGLSAPSVPPGASNGALPIARGGESAANGPLAKAAAPVPSTPARAEARGGSGLAATPVAGKRRELLLRFRVLKRGLVCEPWWLEDGRPAARALVANGSNGAAKGATGGVGHGNGLVGASVALPAGDNGSGKGNGQGGAGGNGHAATAVSEAPPPPPSASGAERIKLISLTALAKKSHFHYHGDLGGYLLDQVAEIPHFLKTVLPGWARSFKIEQEAAVARLETGVQAVSVEARARRREGNAIDLEWVFRTGEQMIGAAHVKQLTSAHGGPVLIPEIGVVALAPESAQSLRQWRDSTAGFAEGELPAYLLFSLFNDKRFPLALAPELESWRRDLLEARPYGYAVPDFLRPYQKRGVEWLGHLCDHGCHGLLADEMGLGKTVQVASLIAARPVQGKTHLVVCPASVVPVWQEEVRRFFPDQTVFVLKSGHDFRQEKKAGIWLASYAQLRNHRALLADFEFGYAILDEGQFIKNPDAKVTRTCFEIRARHRLVLTGTPLENRQLDLWSILHFLLPGLLGTRAAFEAALLRDRDGTVETLRRQIAPFLLRRTKAEVAQELPPKVEMDLFCPLTELQRQEYARVCREGLNRLGDDINLAIREKSFGFLSLLTRLRQICCDPDLLPWLHADLSASGKLSLLRSRLGEIVSSGHKVVIFSQFVTFLERVEQMLQRDFPDVPRFGLTGATIDRQKPVQDFQNIDRAALMLVSLKAAGTGITLHSADYVFLLDPWWNPSVEEQAVDRVHRIGQTRTVFVYRMVTQGTIEERIQALKAEKKQLFRRIIDGVSGDIDLSQHFESLRTLIELAAEIPDLAESTDDFIEPVPL